MDETAPPAPIAGAENTNPPEQPALVADFLSASIPEPTQVLGLRLKPFCLGHAMHLARFDCAFGLAEASRTPTVADLLLAVVICHHTYEGFLEFIDNPNWVKEIQEWGKNCNESDETMTVLDRINIGFNFEEKCRILQDYIVKASRQPAVQYEREGKPSGAHWIQSVKTSLISEGYTPSQALNLPLGQAFADFYKIAENAGAVKIIPPETAELIRLAELSQQQQPEVPCGA